MDLMTDELVRTYSKKAPQLLISDDIMGLANNNSWVLPNTLPDLALPFGMNDGPPPPEKGLGKHEPRTRPKGQALRTLLRQIYTFWHQGPMKTEARFSCSSDERTYPCFA